MANKKKQGISRWLWVIPLVMILLMAILLLPHIRNLQVDDILNFTPSNLFMAALCLCGLYALKSLTVVFPLVVLSLAAGRLFGITGGIVVNLIGLSLSCTIPYLLGRFTQADALRNALDTHPKAKLVVNRQKGNLFFLSYLLRIVNVLPGDLVSMLLGAMKTPYLRYLAGSLLGMFPSMAATTVVGEAITDPSSPAFIISCCMIVVIALTSLLVYRRVTKE